MVIKLNWETSNLDDHYTICSAKIFLDYTIWIVDNGEGYYNLELSDQYNTYERSGLSGASTVEGAKIEAEKWVKEQCSAFLYESI